MFLKPTRKTVRGKTYTNHLLVESISTPDGPRHRTICSLGSLVLRIPEIIMDPKRSRIVTERACK